MSAAPLGDHVVFRSLLGKAITGKAITGKAITGE